VVFEPAPVVEVEMADLRQRLLDVLERERTLRLANEEFAGFLARGERR
jgi:hypothetical protein